MEQFIGKEVRLFPSNDIQIFAILEEVNENGFVFRITYSGTRIYKKDDIVFYSHSKGVVFKLKEIQGGN